MHFEYLDHEGERYVWYSNELMHAHRMGVSIDEITSTSSTRKAIYDLIEAGFLKAIHQGTKRYLAINWDLVNAALEKVKEMGRQVVKTTRRVVRKAAQVTHETVVQAVQTVETVVHEAKEIISHVPDAISRAVEAVTTRWSAPSTKIPDKLAETPLTGQERAFTGQLIDTWNKRIKKVQISDTPANHVLLVEALEKHFKNDINRFAHYCELLLSSDYIMGNSFTLSLSWALSPTTVSKILSGEMGVSKKEFMPPTDDLNREAYNHIDSITEHPECKRFRKELLELIGAASYNSWFKQVKMSPTTTGIITFKYPNSWVENTIESRFKNHMERALRNSQ